MTNKKLRFFIKAAETQNLSLAAKELFIAQPALSKSIKDLEAEIGYSLFDRIGKKIYLNDNGRLFYQYATSLLHSYHNLEVALQELNHENYNDLILGVAVGSQLLSEIIEQFSKSNPEAQIRIISAFPLDYQHSSIDILIDAKECDNPTDNLQSYFTKDEHLLLSEDILLAIPNNHPLAENPHIHYEETLQYPYVLPAKESRMGILLNDYFNNNNFPRPKSSTIVNNSYLQCEFVAKGFGISLVPAKSWPQARNNPNLVLRKMDDFSFSRHIYYSLRPNDYHSHLTVAFAAFLESYYHRL